MRKSNYRALTCAALLGVLLSDAAEAASNERFPRWYIGLNGGYTVRTDGDVKGSGVTRGKATFDNGYDYGAVIGYMPPFSMGPGGVRIEAEVFHFSNDVSNTTLNGVVLPNGGSADGTSYMVNALYDFGNLGHGVMPYVGLGFGTSEVNLPRSAGFGNINESDNVFAWQILAGLGYQPVSLPNTIWSIGYRYHEPSRTAYSVTGGQVKLDTAINSFEGGVKFRF